MKSYEIQKHTAVSNNFMKKTGKALGDYRMIREGDHVLVGLSGGKDSVIMLISLLQMQKKIRQNFTVKACTIDITGGEMDLSDIERLCRKLNVEYLVENSPVLDIIKAREERSPCSLCANMRRGALCKVTEKLGCNVLALGHNLDDVAETVLLNLFRNGRFKCFKPVTWLSRSEVRVIRPLVYIEESHIASEIERLDLPTIENCCPFDKSNERQSMKILIEKLKIDIPDIKTSIKNSLARYEPEDIWQIKRGKQ